MFELTMPLRSTGITLLHHYYGLLPVRTHRWFGETSASEPSRVDMNLVFLHPLRCPLYSGRSETSLTVNYSRS